MNVTKNISKRMLLYRVSFCKTYNSRSVSSLVCVSLFSTVMTKNPTNNGCPKAVTFLRIISDLICIENFKTKIDRYMYFSFTAAGKYAS